MFCSGLAVQRIRRHIMKSLTGHQNPLTTTGWRTDAPGWVLLSLRRCTASERTCPTQNRRKAPRLLSKCVAPAASAPNSYYTNNKQLTARMSFWDHNAA